MLRRDNIFCSDHWCWGEKESERPDPCHFALTTPMHLPHHTVSSAANRHWTIPPDTWHSQSKPQLSNNIEWTLFWTTGIDVLLFGHTKDDVFFAAFLLAQKHLDSDTEKNLRSLRFFIFHYHITKYAVFTVACF
jgi:hypothetical protein